MTAANYTRVAIINSPRYPDDVTDVSHTSRYCLSYQISVFPRMLARLSNKYVI